jgi:hypothetical protein
MNLHELPFAKITILQEDVAEVFVNDGVEMNVDMVDQYHAYLLSHLRAPFSLLINKANSYTYNFEAQQKLATLKEIKAMAVVAYNRVTICTTETLLVFPRDENWNLKIFTDRGEALAWLLLQQGEMEGIAL